MRTAYFWLVLYIVGLPAVLAARASATDQPKDASIFRGIMVFGLVAAAIVAARCGSWELTVATMTVYAVMFAVYLGHGAANPGFLHVCEPPRGTFRARETF